MRDDTTSVEGSIANVTNANALISTPETSVGTAPIDSLSQKSDKSSGDVQFSLSNPVEEKYNSLYDARALEVIEIEKIKKNQMLQARSTKNPQARATLDSAISISDLLQLVNGVFSVVIPKTVSKNRQYSVYTTLSVSSHSSIDRLLGIFKTSS